MVNTEQVILLTQLKFYYNILNIVVNTERNSHHGSYFVDYNILNIVVNTEQEEAVGKAEVNYNILNIVVNTELF